MKTVLLTQGKVALIDDADYAVVSQFKWCAVKNGERFYAARNIRKPNGKQKLQYLHQFLLPGVGKIDHRDGNSLNDQRYNLRPATTRQNAQGVQRKRPGTTSKFRGVCWHKTALKWLTQIRVDGHKIHLGLFENESDAARAYDAAARKYFGDFASLNFN